MTGIFCVGMLPVAHAQGYDPIIKGSRVMDPETMYDGIANVRIKGDRIVAITSR